MQRAFDLLTSGCPLLLIWPLLALLALWVRLDLTGQCRSCRSAWAEMVSYSKF